MQIYQRITYLLQMLSSFNLFLALFLPWHQKTHSAASLLLYTLPAFKPPFNFLMLGARPWWVLLLLVPFILTGIVRGFAGIIDNSTASGLKLARRTGYIAILPLGWFYLSSQEWGNTDLQFGYWLTLLAAGMLFSLVWLETVMVAADALAKQPREVLCPHCNTPNEYGLRRCQYCNRIIFYQ